MTSTPSRSTGAARRPAIGSIARLALLVAAAGASGAAGCRHGRDALWVEQVKQPPQDDAYRVAPGDQIAVRVFGQDAMSADRLRVREDGKVSLPFLQDVDVGGQTPDEISTRLRAKLKAYVVSPVVTVTVVERGPLKVSVLGEVARPGVYDLERGAGVLHALAAAGGLTEYAHRDRIYVLRQSYWADDSAPARIRFRYDRLVRGEKPATSFRLTNGDVVVVE